MKRSLMLLVLLLVSVPAFGQTQNCDDYPIHQIIGPGNGFNEYVLDDTCLTGPSGAYIPNAPYCAGSTNAWKFSTTKVRMSKSFTIPAGSGWTHWGVSYLLDKVDPYQDGWWTFLQAKVYNVTDNVVLAQHTYWGDDPDVTCHYRSLAFTANLAGKTIRVEFLGQAVSSSTAVRIKSISLTQSE